MSAPLENRFEFVLLFDVKDGNPNGDPDAGNLPRIDPETGHGLVTDVCLKRKVRNYVGLTRAAQEGYDIYVKEKAVLGRAHTEAYKKLGIGLGEEHSTKVPEELVEELNEAGAPAGLRVEVDEDGETMLVTEIDMEKKEVEAWLKEIGLSKPLTKVFKDAIKSSKPRKPKGDEVKKGRDEMCRRFFDVRTFGAVMTLTSAPNCGQVRGPVQFTFSRSIDQAVPLEHSITRMAVATEAEAEKQQGDNRTMGRKFTIPYALYRCHGYISAPLAAQTGFGQDDLELLWESLMNMFEHDRSAARGEMTPRKLVVFKHDGLYGSSPSHLLFERVGVERIDAGKPPRAFSDYRVTINTDGLPGGVELLEMI